MTFLMDTMSAMGLNIVRLGNTLDIKLDINFRGDYVYVKKVDKIIYKDNWRNYKEDYESQKEFILNVVNKLFKYARIDETMGCYKIKIDNCIYENIVGNADFIFDNHRIKLDTKKFKRCKAWGYNLDDYNEYMDCLDELFEIIRDNIDKNKIRAVFENRNGFGDYLIVDRALKEYIININGVKAALYCSDTSDTELKKAINFINSTIFSNRIRKKIKR